MSQQSNNAAGAGGMPNNTNRAPLSTAGYSIQESRRRLLETIGRRRTEMLNASNAATASTARGPQIGNVGSAGAMPMPMPMSRMQAPRMAPASSSDINNGFLHRSSKEQPGSLTASNAFPKNGFANSVPTSNGGSFTHMKFPTVQQQRAAASVTAGGYRGSLASVPAGALRFQQPQAQAANTAPGVGISPGSGLSVRRRPSQPHAAVQATADSSSVGVSPVLRTAVQPHPLRDPLHQQHQAAHQLDVTPQPHPFFDHLEVVMPPTALVPSRINNRQQTAELTFSLSRQQAETVALNRYRLPGVGRQRTDYGVQVLLRCFKIGPGELPDCFPPGVSLAVNANQVTSLPPPLPTCRQNSDQQAATALAGYCVTVSLARALTAQQLTQRVLELSPIPASGTRTKIVDMLGGSGGGDEVALTDLTASLRCPLTRSRIGIPARGRDCAHLQCFDASVFLTMNERKSSWRCPCCDRPLRLDDLRVDELFRDILAARPRPTRWTPSASCPTAAGCPPRLSSPGRRLQLSSRQTATAAKSWWPST
uniref:SP-RING-type domain-containing protein n=1 Tax=Macrostomum lignano TaxID=282301 RepID=A0A1I8IPQ1_9PLAT